RRAGPHEGALREPLAPVYEGTLLGRPSGAPRHRAARGHPAGRGSVADQPAFRLPLPSPLQLRDASVRRGGPGREDARQRPYCRVSFVLKLTGPGRAPKLVRPTGGDEPWTHLWAC